MKKKGNVNFHENSIDSVILVLTYREMIIFQIFAKLAELFCCEISTFLKRE